MSNSEKSVAFVFLGVLLLAGSGMAIEAQKEVGKRRIIPAAIERPPCWPSECPSELQDIVQASVPYLDLPKEFRVKNYAGGSCVHAATGTLLYWQGFDDLAQWWTSSYSGGEYSQRLHRRLDAAGIRYAFTTEGDWEFVERCVGLRLGCAVNWPSGHMVTLVGMDEQNVYLIDNNSTHAIATRSKQQFKREWGGWATTIVYTPPPPPPYAL